MNPNLFGGQYLAVAALVLVVDSPVVMIAGVPVLHTAGS